MPASKVGCSVYRRHRSNCCARQPGCPFRQMPASGWRSIRPACAKEEGAKQVVLGRILFDKGTSTDPRTSGPYKNIEALTRYDCAQRTYTTLKRTLAVGRGRIAAGGNASAAEMPVRSGSLDDKMLREVCRPKRRVDQQSAASKVAEKANEAATELRKANEAMIQKEVQKKSLKTAVLPAPLRALPPREGSAAADSCCRKLRPPSHVRSAVPPPSGHEPAQQHAGIHWGLRRRRASRTTGAS